MTDLLDVIPDFPAEPHARVIAALEAHLVTTSDLLSLDAVELARRSQLPILDLKHFVKEVIRYLHRSYRRDLEFQENRNPQAAEVTRGRQACYSSGLDLAKTKSLISTLDDSLDSALSGGIATGYVTEVTGESGAGKTQFLLTLLLSAQLASSQHRTRGAIYISTEHALPTQRLESILDSHPRLKDNASKPSLNQILSIQISDLETQDHILNYQLPVAVKSKDISLVVIDSIAANYRAEAETSKHGDANRSQAKALAARATDLIRLGALLRDIASQNDCAIVVANQVSDRFEQRTLYDPLGNILNIGQSQERQRNNADDREHARMLVPPPSGTAAPLSSPLSLSNFSSSPTPFTYRSHSTFNGPPSPTLQDHRLSLDYQMRFFTGWGDSESHHENLKTPTLGLTWTNQIACRIAILRESTSMANPTSYGHPQMTSAENGKVALQSLPESGLGGADWSKRRWRRWMKVVFASWAQETGEGEKGVEFEVWSGGIRALTSS